MTDFALFLLALLKCSLYTGLGPAALAAALLVHHYERERAPAKVLKFPKKNPFPIRRCRDLWRQA